ncbi:hypothetical protein LTR05_006987 [Lithohypha guttulata]|uniref:Major facilitator superfamily (MFS) profile domain-containing protein n=1 Tax=Lithohypha guttulata TaxID=1690604 RepID=A0AAN7SWV3_9EURO|nr:hypothetical protein LTR05_006987 [Lithohypha guttulata]
MAPSNNDDFPWRQAGVLAICRLAEPIAFVSITSYAFVMVQDIHGDKDASFYAGLLVSAFAAAEACTAFLWGSLSDRYGRKPIILVALAGTALSSLIFGFAKNYWLAIFARIVGGALNGNVAVMQTMVAEMVHKPEHEPMAYALQPVMWAVGSVAGSALGGFTAQPARWYPNVFSEDGIFGQYPYLLPNLVAVVMILLAMIQGLFLLEETNPALIGDKEDAQKPTRTNPAMAADERTPLNPGIASLRRERRESVMSKASYRSGGLPYIAVHAPIPIDPGFDLRRGSIVSIGSFGTLRKRPSIAEYMRAHAHTHAVAVDDEEDDEEESLEVPEKAFTKEVWLWVSALWLLCYHQMAFAALLPVYLVDDPRKSSLDLLGGLGKTLPEVGTILAVNSVISLLAQAVVFPIFVAKIGVWWSGIILIVLSPLVYFLPPFVSLMSDPVIGIYLVMIFQALTSTMAYPIILLLLKNACPSPLVLGRVNGLAMSGCSAARTIAPPIVGAVYSALGSAGGWWSATLIAIIGVIELFFIRRPKEDNEEVLRRASVSAEAYD